MNHEEILGAVEKRLGPLNERDQAVAQAMLDILAQKVPPLSLNSAETGFEGKNLPMEQWATLTPEERGRFLQTLEERNKEWLARQFQQLRAGWLVVLDGDVRNFGADLSNAPTDQELYAQGELLGRCPLLFINEILLAIEEPALAWHVTTLAQDLYPTLPIDRINPTRTALVGRGLCLSLAPEIKLDFAQRLTTLNW